MKKKQEKPTRQSFDVTVTARVWSLTMSDACTDVAQRLKPGKDGYPRTMSILAKPAKWR